MFYELRCNNTIKCNARMAVHEILQEPMGFWNLDPPNCSTHKKATAAENLLTNSTVEEGGKKKERAKERAEEEARRRGRQ